ncbi:hypothetical protein [Methylomagnum sp.]
MRRTRHARLPGQTRDRRRRRHGLPKLVGISPEQWSLFGLVWPSARAPTLAMNTLPP